MSSKQLCDIYALIDPETDEIRYIGKSNNAQNRLNHHIRDRVKRKVPVSVWINDLMERGMRPRLVVLERVVDWEEAEIRLIAVSRARGDRLLNVADGGIQPYCSTEQRRKNANKLNKQLKDNPLLAYVRYLKAQIGIGLRQGHLSNTAREKLRLAAAKRPDLFGCWAGLPNVSA